MKRIKRFLSILLIVSMVLCTHGTYVLAEGVGNTAKTEGGTVHKSYADNTSEATSIDDGNSLSDKNGSSENSGSSSGDNENDNKNSSNNINDKNENDDDNKDEPENESIETSSNDDETSSVKESSTVETSKTETTIKEDAESTNNSSNATTNTTKGEATTKKEIADEENTATDSDAENDTTKDTKINSLELEATTSETNNSLFGGEEEKATDSDITIPEPPTFHKPSFGNIDDDYIAPKAESSTLFGTDPLPTRWDSREHTNTSTGLSYVSPIRFQNPYGICWAFATAGMFETSIRKKGLAKTDAESNLSELALAYFMYNLSGVTKNPSFAGTPGLEGDDHTMINTQYFISRNRADEATWSECGGNQALSTKMLTSYVGMVVEDETTEFSDDGNKTQAMKNAEWFGLPGRYAFNKNAYVPKDIQYINKVDRDLIKQAIMDNGSVGFSYHAEWEAYNGRTPDDFAFHWDDDGSYYHSRNRVDSTGRAQTNHAIMIIGWDDTIPKEKFYFGGQGAERYPDYTIMQYVYTNPPTQAEYDSVTQTGWKSTSNGAWIARNSWSANPYYLKDGYFYIPYDEPSLSEVFYSVDAIPADTYKYNYHYDTTAFGGSQTIDTVGNIYKVSGPDDTQVIEAVNVGIDDADAEYDIKIYVKDSAMNNPTDGELKSSKRCSNKLAGFYTFELDTPVTVAKDTYFSVVVESTDDYYGMNVFYDNYYHPTGAWYFTYNEIKEKQSFRGANYGSYINWYDTYSNYSTETSGGRVYGRSFRIKALANSGLAVSFDSDGGEGTMRSQAMQSGVPTNLKKNTFKKSGYRFKNWVNPDTGDEYEDGAEITITGPITLKAVWEEARFLLSPNWYNETISGMSEQNITSIKIQMYPTASPSNVNVSWIIPGSSGLIASRKGTEVFIYAPDTSITGKIDLPADSNHLFSKRSSANPDAADWAHVFSHCETLDGLNLLDTSNVTNMKRMFAGLGNLNMYDNTMMNLLPNPKEIAIDVSTFDTSKVIDMSLMFEQAAIKNININTFNTRSLTNSRHMFAQCGILQSLDLSNFGTATISEANGMFELCISMSSINLSGATFENATTLAYMFKDCRSLTSLDLSSFKTNNVTDMAGMFSDCSTLQTVTVSRNFVIDAVTTSDNMFDNCTVLRGGNNTIYEDSNPKDKTYARVDGKNALPGYFTSTGSVSVTFDYDGKGVNYSETYEKGETINRPADPTYNGYTFEHWYKEGTSATTPYDFTQAIPSTSPATMKLIAKWTAKSYTINLDAKGGTITGDTSFTKIYDTPYTSALPTPTKTGWTFGGWYRDDGTFTNEYNKSNDVIYIEGTLTYTIYAKWTAKTYTINYIAGTGATVSPTSFTKTYGTAITTDLAEPSKTGHTFDDWYKENTYDNVYDKTSDDIYVEGQTTPYNIYAKFTPNQYTVDYDLVGVGATKPSTITKIYDSPLTSGVLKDPTNIPAGYEFLGWFKSYDSTTGNYGDQWTGADDLTTGTTTQIIYAKWKRAIVYNVLKNGVDIGATAVPSKEITGETTYNLPSTSAAGYIFGGWYGEAACTTFRGNAGDPITVSVPTTLYAKWTPVSYKIYYKNVDGSSITDGEYVTKTYGTTVTLNTTPTKTGYVFDGWFTDNTTFANSYDGTTDIASTQDDDKNIYAKWTANEYQVNYNLSGISATAPSTPVTKTYGKTLAAGTLKNPTNIPTGYTFAGWYKESTFANEWTGADDLTTGTTAQTIYARWKAKITYNANGHGTAPSAVDVYLNTTTVLPSITNVTGYTFDTTESWYDGSDTSTATLIGAAGGNYTVTVPKELFAKWNEDEYTITYEKKDGNWTGTTPSNKRKYSEEVTLPVATDIAKNDGVNDYIFKGWYTVDGSTTTWDETKKVTKINANTVAPAGGHVFYARWNPAWKITFNMLSHGTAPSDIVAEQGTKVPTADVPANPSETGYIFSGWYKNYDSTLADFDARYTNQFNFSTDTVTTNMTLYAKWKPISYTIRYNANGGTVTPTTDTKVYDANLTLAVPTREGYDFDAWYQNYDSTTKTFTNPYDGTSNISTTNGDTKDVYAKWIAHQYTVDYNLGGVTGAVAPTSTITKTYGEPLAVGVLKNPSVIPSGYEFIGWYKEATCVNQWTGADDLTTGTATQFIYAKWKTAVVFSVLYQGNDIGATVPTSIEITGPTDINLPTTSATGYTFGGWYREAELTNLVPNPVNVTVPTTFYAKWTPVKYEITYNTLGGTLPGATQNPFEKTYGVNATLVNPTYEGYDFAGWYSDYNSTTKAYSGPFDGSTDISTDTTGKTIYAKWNPHKYNINYELLDHATAMTPYEKTYGVSYTPPTPTGIEAGYKFDGWFKESTFATAYNGEDLTTGTDEQTIYARWKATVTYDANGHGTAPAAVDVILGQPTRLPSIANVTGWTFDTVNSWYDGSDVSTATLIGAAGENYTVNAPKKLYARWKENDYSITYDKDGGEWVAYDPVEDGDTTRKYSEEKTLPVALKIAKTGYTFLGWYRQGDATKTVIAKINANTDASVIVVAKWSENTYNITLNRNGGNYVSGYTVPTTRKYTDAVTLPTNDDIKKTGHRLEGWFEQSDYSGSPVTSIAVNTAAHKTFYAKWVPETYIVTLNKNGGIVTPASDDVTEYTYGTGATLPTNVTKANSVFKGWWTLDGTTSENWGSQVTAISGTDTGEKTYFARWANSYTVTFDLLSGTTHPAALTDITNAPTSQNVEHGGVAVRPSVNPQANNFEFVGWYTDNTLITEYNFSSQVTSTTTIYAKWNSVATHKVTFNLISGTTPHPTAVTDITGVPDAQYIVNGRTVTKPADPTATGYSFVGWYTDDTFATAWNFASDTIIAPKIIYGKWSEVSYSIKYHENGGTYIDGYTKPISRTYTESKTLPTEDEINKHAYTFGGWFESSIYEGSAITEIPANTARDVTVYAKWSPVPGSRIITFYDNYSGATFEQAFISGEDSNLRTNIFTRSGYTFIRWKDNAGNVVMNTKQLADSDIALFAEWQKLPTPIPEMPGKPVTDDSGGSSSSGSRRSSGPPIQQNQQQQQQTNTQAVSKQVEVSTSKSEQVVVNGYTASWTYDPVKNSWKLSALDLGGVPTNAANGFFIVSQVTVVMENNNFVPKTVQDTYYFDSTGNMVTGWVKTNDNKWYFFNDEKTLDEGKLCIGWKKVDGSWYFFSSNDGSMVTNTVTSDGYKIGSDGRWIQ